MSRRVLAICWITATSALGLWSVWPRIVMTHGHGWARLIVAFSFALSALLLSGEHGQRGNARLLYALTIVYLLDQLGLRDIGPLEPVSMLAGGFVTVLGFTVLLRYPLDALDRWSERFVLTLAAAAALLQVALLVTGRWPWDRLGVSGLPSGLPHQTLFTGLFHIKTVWGAVSFVVFLGLLIRHWRSLVRLDRRTITPLILAAVVVGALSIVDAVANIASVPGALLIGEVRGYSIALLAAAFAACALRSRLQLNAIAGLAEDLRQPVTTRQIRDALRDALADDSLVVLFWVDEHARYVDGAGQPVEVPSPPGRLVFEVTDRAGRPLALLVTDPALAKHGNVVAAAVRISEMALENARLEVGLRTQLLVVQEARERLLHVGLAQRRRLERDLHDGAQQRLLGLGLRLAAIEATADQPATVDAVKSARQELLLALEELRDLAHGLYPAILTQGGLAPALEDATERLSLDVTLNVPAQRWHPDVESTAYLMVCEALANIVKHAGVCSATVTVTSLDRDLAVCVEDDGKGFSLDQQADALAGMRDRLAALGGHLRITSTPGKGTRVEARIPAAEGAPRPG